MKIQEPYFAFIDEVGTGKDPNQPFFGVGVLILKTDDKTVFKINQQMRNIFMGAVNSLKANPNGFEFKFKFITKRSLPYYLKILQIIDQNINIFKFSYKLERSEERQWEQYLGLIKRIISKQKSKVIVLADYLHKPKNAVKTLADLVNHEKIIRTLQIEGQTSVFLQIADILLGAVNYSKGNKKDEIKEKVVKKVLKIIKK